MADSLHIRLTPAVRQHLERLAAVGGVSLSQAARTAVMRAAFPEGDVPDEDELLRLLGQAARAGSVPAIKELLAHYREAGEWKSSASSLAAVDELAEHRAREANRS